MYNVRCEYDAHQVLLPLRLITKVLLITNIEDA